MFSIEIIGGGTRIPFIKDLINKVFKMPASTTLNGRESIVRGCSIYADMIRNNFKINFKVKEFDY